MSDLISREALIKAFETQNKIYRPNGLWHITGIEALIKNVPTVDAIEVVRCKDCESYIPGKRICESDYLSGYTIPNGYCFSGVRKKGLYGKINKEK